MGKSKKLAKGRLDKFYRMAKEHGYRSRAAFKLIQLNKQFNFLGTANIVIDLCCAPGSWCQVATKYMPINKQIIALDLDPIKPIPHVTSFATDITTPKCRQEIKRTIGAAKADVVLHDGAPNVGTEWTQDAFTQAELALSATKLATEFLKPGGWFVTKVFRSAEYNKLLWVLHQLFERVVPTKPQASRAVSAEIFVVCKGFLAPAKIDPKVLDPKFVFTDVTGPAQQVNVFEQTRKTPRNRSGYADGVTVLYKDTTVHDFVSSEDPITMLSNYNAFVFKDDQSKRYESHKATNPDIKACLADLKVLNKKDFKALLKWRQKMKTEFEVKIVKAQQSGDEESGEAEDDEIEDRPLTEEEKEQQLQEELDLRVSNLNRQAKKKEKKRREAKDKLRKRMAFQVEVDDEFTAPGAEEESLFNLKLLKNTKSVSSVADSELPADHELASDEEEDKMEVDAGDDADSEDENAYDRMIEDNLDTMYKFYSAKKKKREAALAELEDRSSNKKRQQDTDVNDIPSDLEDEVNEYENGGNNGLVVKDFDTPTESQTTQMWFNQDMFKSVVDDEFDETAEIKRMLSAKKRKLTEEASAAVEVPEPGKPKKQNDKKQVRFAGSDDDSDGDADNNVDDSDDESGDDEAADNEDFEVVAAEDYPSDDSDDDNYTADMDIDEKARVMALAKKMINSQERNKVINASFNKFMFSDRPNLPWFVEDEENHNRPLMPVTEEEVAAEKGKLTGIDARNSKKVLEAKARKKRHMLKQLEKAKTKATQIFDNDEMTPGQKMKEVDKLYKRAKAKQKPQKVYVVARKFKTGAAGSGGGPTRTRFVDSRLKKEKRAERARQKRKR